jgi:multicomponent Na+:H+ antiporter subunit D
VSGELWIALVLLLPVLGAGAIALLGRRPELRDGAMLLVAVATCGAVAKLAPAVSAGARPELALWDLFPGVSLRFELEPLGLLFALVASGLWIATGVYAIGYMRGHHETHQTRFFACFSLAIGSALGVAFAGNLLTLFLFYELLTLSTYPLVTHHGTDEAMRAGRVYLGILLSTSIGMLLAAVLWTASLTGTLDFRPGGILAGRATPAQTGLLLALFMFGTGKAALMPFHRWLPAAMVAPAPVSALLHAVAVVKAGVFTVLKISIYVFGPDHLRETGVSTALTYVAGATLLGASLIALGKDNLKVRLAYSTVGQLAYIVLGAMLGTTSGLIGGGLHLAMHAMGKITLFFCAGAIDVAHHKQQVSEMDGIGRAMPFTMSAFLLGSLGIIGVPPAGGAWSKWYLALGALDAHQPLFAAVLMLSSLLSTGYLMPVVARAFFARGGSAPAGVREAPLLCVVPLCITGVGTLLLFFAGPALYRLLEPIARGG